MASIQTIVEGNVLMSTATFTAASTGAAIDPETIEFLWVMSRQPGSGANYTYTSSSSPAAGTVARTGTGVYVAEVNLTGQFGTLIWEWVSTGQGQASAFGQLPVTQLPLPQ